MHVGSYPKLFVFKSSNLIGTAIMRKKNWNWISTNNPDFTDTTLWRKLRSQGLLYSREGGRAIGNSTFSAKNTLFTECISFIKRYANSFHELPNLDWPCFVENNRLYVESRLFSRHLVRTGIFALRVVVKLRIKAFLFKQ